MQQNSINILEEVIENYKVIAKPFPGIAMLCLTIRVLKKTAEIGIYLQKKSSNKMLPQ